VVGGAVVTGAVVGLVVSGAIVTEAVAGCEAVVGCRVCDCAPQTNRNTKYILSRNLIPVINYILLLLTLWSDS